MLFLFVQQTTLQQSVAVGSKIGGCGRAGEGDTRRLVEDGHQHLERYPSLLESLDVLHRVFGLGFRVQV